MIVYAPYYTTWREQNLIMHIVSCDWNVRYLARSADICDTTFRAAIHAGQHEEAINYMHRPFPFSIERAPPC